MALIGRTSISDSASLLAKKHGSKSITSGSPTISVIVPARNEEEYIEECIESLLLGNEPLDAIEILIVDGRSDDRTRDIVSRFEVKYPQTVRLIENPNHTVPYARNIGIEEARGEFIAFADAHARYPSGYALALVEAMRSNPEASNVGFLLKTLPASDTLEAQGIAVAMSHMFGVGDSLSRIGVKKPTWVDSVFGGCFKRDVFEEIGKYDEELIRNQDDELNHRLLKNNGRILLLPNLSVEYFARPTIMKLGRMLYQYGYFKPLTMRKLGRPMTLRQLAPFGLFCILTLLLVLSMLTKHIWAISAFAGLCCLYLAAAGVAAVDGSIRSPYGFRIIPSLFASFLTMHASYAWGFARGIWDFILFNRRIDNAPLSR